MMAAGPPADYSALIMDERPVTAAQAPASTAAPAHIAWHEHAIFALLGVGPGWLLCDALFLQIPWAQATQPEGLALSSWMLSAFNAANVVVVLLLIAHRLWPRNPRELDEILLVALILATVGGLALAALLWQVATERHSVALLAFAFVGGAIGALRLSVMMPWMLAYDERLISSAVLGGAIADGASAMVALVQQPGGVRRFSPSAFFLVSTMFALPSLGAFVAIKRWYGHLLQQPAARSTAPPTGTAATVGVELEQVAVKSASDKVGARAAAPKRAARPWLWRAVRLWLVFAFMQSLVWGITPALLPFAARNAARGSGAALASEDVLSYAIDVSYLGLVAGSYASLVWSSYRLAPQVVLLVACAAVTVVMAYAGQPLLSARAGSTLLVGSTALMRFMDGYATAMIFRSVSADTRYGDAQQAVQRAISLAERVSTTIGAFVAFWLVGALMRADAAVASD